MPILALTVPQMICSATIEKVPAMNMNQLANMFTRMVAQRAMKWGINKGMSKLSRDKAGTPPPVAGQKTARNNDLAKRMRTLARLTRR